MARKEAAAATVAKRNPRKEAAAAKERRARKEAKATMITETTSDKRKMESKFF